MTFITIGQYFNKLQSAILAMVIIPLLVFAALYFYLSGTSADPRSEYLILIPVALLDWVMALVIFNKKIKSVRNAQGLGIKLDKYFKITIVRFSILSSASLVLALGLYLTGKDVFTLMYFAGMVLTGVLWPTSRKVSDDLLLRGDERQMVYYKQDKF